MAGGEGVERGLRDADVGFDADEDDGGGGWERRGEERRYEHGEGGFVDVGAAKRRLEEGGEGRDGGA